MVAMNHLQWPVGVNSCIHVCQHNKIKYGQASLQYRGILCPFIFNDCCFMTFEKAFSAQAAINV